MKSLICLSVTILCFLTRVLLGEETRSQPNVLVIVADDLGYSDLGCYGGEIRTPHLDSLAENGVRLTRFYTMARCCPSRACLLTGQYPHRVGVGHKVKDLKRPGYRGRIASDVQTLGNQLQDAGYRTFISGKWHLGTPDPTQNGFEEFYGTLVSAQTFWDPDHYLRFPEGRTHREYKPGSFYGTDAITDYGLDFLRLAEQTPKKPWFLYLAYNAPHFPLQAPPDEVVKYKDTYQVGWDAVRERRLGKLKSLGIIPKQTRLTPRSRYWNYGETKTGINPAWDSIPSDRLKDLARRMAIYAAMIDRMDQNIGRILKTLKVRGELKNTLILFVSDNGACAEWDPYGFDVRSSNHNILHTGKMLDRMGQNGTYHSVGSGWANASNTPWRLQKHYTHEGGINSPCIIHWPNGGIRQGVIDHQPSHLIDIVPTVLAAANITKSDRMPLPGISLLPMLGTGDHTLRTLFFEHEGNRAVHAGTWKLVALRDEPWELYNTKTDRTELQNMADQHPDIVSQLSKQWDVWAEENFVTPLPQDYGVDYLRKPNALDSKN